jgi:hypothetical protein
VNARIARLRQESFETPVTLDHERAAIVTDVYREHLGRLSVPMLRATALLELCRRKTIHLGADELIVGERGPRPKCVSTYPEVTCHSPEDLEVLDARPQNPYRVSDEARRAFAEDIAPFWRGRTMRGPASSPSSWSSARRATPPWTARSTAAGLVDFQAEIDAAALPRSTRFSTRRGARREQLAGHGHRCDAGILFAERHADEAERDGERPPTRAARPSCERSPQVCRRVPATPRATSTRRCRCTGSCTWRDHPSSTAGTP